jgi:chromosome segregation ATPase
MSFNKNRLSKTDRYNVTVRAIKVKIAVVEHCLDSKKAPEWITLPNSQNKLCSWEQDWSSENDKALDVYIDGKKETVTKVERFSKSVFSAGDGLDEKSKEYKGLRDEINGLVKRVKKYQAPKPKKRKTDLEGDLRVSKEKTRRLTNKLLKIRREYTELRDDKLSLEQQLFEKEETISELNREQSKILGFVDARQKAWLRAMNDFRNIVRKNDQAAAWGLLNKIFPPSC